MRAESIGFENFRNLKKNTLLCHESVNVIYGDNAHGKTNLLEAIWLFSGARSFRGAKDNECVTHGEERARLELKFEADRRTQQAVIDIKNNRRYASLGGVALKSAGELAGNFRAVVFSPAHLSLIKDGPAGRRRFLDTAIGQLWPKYIGVIKDYSRCLQQRNALLRDVKYHTQLFDMLDVYDGELASLGGRIAGYRAKYTAKLGEYTDSIYAGISGGREKAEIKYIANGGNTEKELSENLKNARGTDIAAGVTTAGPHRDELEVTINGMAARAYGSQGQQRSAVIALKMSEAAVITELSGEEPVLLLDDVMSELDESRQDYILNQIKDRQVFITCCDRNSVGMLKGGASFLMRNGELITEG